MLLRVWLEYSRSPQMTRVNSSKSCMAKHIEGKKLAKANDGLRETQQKLMNEKNRIQSSHDNQLARLHFFDQALESSRLRLTEILKEWNRYSDGLESKLSE